MHWIAPSEKDTANSMGISSLSASQGKRIHERAFANGLLNVGRFMDKAGLGYWPSDAAQFRANSGLNPKNTLVVVLRLQSDIRHDGNVDRRLPRVKPSVRRGRPMDIKFDVARLWSSP